MPAFCSARLVWLLAAALPPAVAAQDGGTLLERINSYRSDPPACAGAEYASKPGPLTPEPALTGMVEEGAGLQQAVRERGYAAARTQVMALTGPNSAQEAMDFLASHYCAALLDPRFSAAGVTREGRRWQVVLAQPKIEPDLGDWRAAGKHVLQEVNAARSKARHCGNQRFDAAEPLVWDQQLAQAARGHSSAMAEHGFLSHRGRNGSTVGERARRANYEWQRIGENVAAGQGSARQVVQGWLSSPGHCSNLMNASFTEMGAAYATNMDSDAVIYWTQMLGKPR